MITTIRLLSSVAALVAVSGSASDPQGFALWRSGELVRREEALSQNVGKDHSARETLGAYDGHRLRMLYRDRDGYPEQHDNEVDVVIVRSGEGTLVVGGRIIDLKAGDGTGEFIGTGIEGGEKYPLEAGDLVHIPPKTPHRFLVREGTHITYVIVKLPAQ
jgi:mannose-6-phosphate isomerase-like protein (cupin superfamily)